jgi:lipopolysaccharide transport system ATP-binding protein
VALCDRAILLDRGKVLEDGDPNRIGKIYHELLFGPPKKERAEAAVEKRTAVASSEPMMSPALSPTNELPASQEHRYGDHRAVIADTFIIDGTGNTVTQLEAGSTYRFRYVIDAIESVNDYVLGLLIRTPRGIEVMGTDTRYWETEGFPKGLEAGRRYNFDIKFVNNFANGLFFLTAAMAENDGTKLDVRFDCLMFEVVGSEKFYSASLVTSDLSFHCESAKEPDDEHAATN